MITPKLPAEEKWGLVSQMKRAAVSIPANIAEGYGRHYFQEGIQFCYHARGSLSEIMTHLVIAYDLGYLSEDDYRNSKIKLTELSQMLNGYIRYLKGRKSSQIDEETSNEYEEISYESID
jgi:four helix bundle protein